MGEECEGGGDIRCDENEEHWGKRVSVRVEEIIDVMRMRNIEGKSQFNQLFQSKCNQ